MNDATVLAELLKSGADDLMLTTDQAAKLLGRSVAELSADRKEGRGPRWVLPFGPDGVVHYRLGDLRAFLNAPAA
ncbi:helix-turn-helix domain-containing protein [Burkholderia glumae]|uniref:helix-turn-helix domain-containing protein n=1 Tax=Burkholderia glumae TaxID=337 RepID=UPI0021647009|nr:helix-turn-helix domain-containing protein [Burkholderia glumae]UVS97360.1 DNA-binding protein [Burkholderia glumae]